MFCARLGVTVVCTGGVHIDQITVEPDPGNGRDGRDIRAGIVAPIRKNINRKARFEKTLRDVLFLMKNGTSFGNEEVKCFLQVFISSTIHNALPYFPRRRCAYIPSSSKYGQLSPAYSYSCR